jgi:hypothetical protein
MFRPHWSPLRLNQHYSGITVLEGSPLHWRMTPCRPHTRVMMLHVQYQSTDVAGPEVLMLQEPACVRLEPDHHQPHTTRPLYPSLRSKR